jgi:glycerophosphoryl diester phosphodiesterase
MAHAPENTLDAFGTALRLGATGIESDVWVTADGVPVLTHRGTVKRGPVGRGRSIASVARADLPATVPSLDDLYTTCGTTFEVSLDVKDPAAAAPAISVARAAGGLDRLWLCHDDVDVLASWRAGCDELRLVNSTRLRRIKEGSERRAATLADRGIDGINLHASDWTGGLTTLFHRFERLTLGWDAQFPRVLLALLGMGIDAVYSDHVDRMVDALAHHLR